MRLPEQGHVVQISIKCGKPKSHLTVAKSVLGLTSLPDIVNFMTVWFGALSMCSCPSP